MTVALDHQTIDLDRPGSSLLDQMEPVKPSTFVWTDEAFLHLPDGDRHYEILDGKLIDMGNSGALHGYVCSTLIILLGGYIRDQKLGAIFDSSTAFTMASGNRRSPDIAFFAKERLRGISPLPSGYLDGAPDLAVEVLSQGNTVAEIDNKLAEYFANGCRLAWIIHPIQRYVLVYRNAQQPDDLLKDADRLTGEDVIPGFEVSVATLLEMPTFFAE
ncbi:MAG: Uma2 family endonuclease [Synechocystis sp.]